MSDPEDVEPSPRTAEEPMAFTRDEFLRGVMASWIAFNLVWVAFIVFWPGSGGPLAGLLFGFVYLLASAPASGVVTAVFAYPVCIIGRTMRRRRGVSLHVAVHALVGTVIGGLVIGVVALWFRQGIDVLNPFVLSTLLSATVALPLGWAWAYCRARRSDAQVSRHPSVGPSLADGGAAS
ncbi:hypothetical protein [Microbacterium sp. CJ88]|uniref:hypothetical protein n=1 Tax=Microbacterium sp. CJ88 TaxID=3445672 RepID=UPI003F65952D